MRFCAPDDHVLGVEVHCYLLSHLYFAAVSRLRFSIAIASACTASARFC